MAVPYTFGSATSAIPLSQLDSNFATAITLGSTALTLGTTTTTVAGLTLTSPVISTIVNTGTLTLPTSTDTLVGRATTDTLTNKSISGSTNTLTNIPNSALTNTTVTIGSTSIALGGTATTVAGLTLTSPTLTTPVLGTPTSGTLTNCTGLPLSTGVTGTLATTNGGTGLTAFTANGVVYASSTSALATGSGLQFNGTNLGVGVTPSAWTANTKALQFAGPAIWNDNYAGSFNAGYNTYQDTNTSYKYIYSSLGAGRYDIAQNVHRWFNAPSGTAGNAISFTQAMTLDNSGNLVVGTTSTINSSKLTVSASGNAANFATSASGSYSLVCQNTGSSATNFVIFQTGSGTTSVGSITTNSSATGIIFNSGTNGGVQFGSSTILTDYEEGSWTPVFTATTPPSGVTYQFISGSYTKIGNSVHLRFGFKLSSKGSGGSGTLSIQGLPFTSSSSPASYQEPNFGCSTGNNNTTANVRWYVASGTTVMYARFSATSSGPINTDTPFDWSDAGDTSYFVSCECMYMTS
jgi:hypothetical protein